MESLILQFINSVLEKNFLLVYLFFFISAVLQMVFPPFPGDVVMIFEGYITSIGHSFGFIPVLITAMAGSFSGSFALYKFGYHNGDAVFKYKLIRKYIDDKHRKRAEMLFEKYGSFAIAVSKFVPGVNAVMVLFSGIFKVKVRVFTLSVFISILVHHILLLLLGRFLGNNLQYVKSIIKAYNGAAIALTILIAAGFSIFWLIKRKRIKIEKEM